MTTRVLVEEKNFSVGMTKDSSSKQKQLLCRNDNEIPRRRKKLLCRNDKRFLVEEKNFSVGMTTRFLVNKKRVTSYVEYLRLIE